MISFTDKLLRAYLKKALHSKKELKISKYGGAAGSKFSMEEVVLRVMMFQKYFCRYIEK